MAQLHTCFARGKAYDCSGNAFWCQPGCGAQSGIPFNARVRTQLMNYYFTKPAEYPWKIIIPLGTEDDPLKMQGSLINLAPPEAFHAFIAAIARDCRKKDGELQAWRNFILSAPFRFEMLTNQMDIWWRACELRESQEETGVSMARTALQRVFEVHEVKAAEEKVP